LVQTGICPMGDIGPNSRTRFRPAATRAANDKGNLKKKTEGGTGRGSSMLHLAEFLPVMRTRTEKREQIPWIVPASSIVFGRRDLNKEKQKREEGLGGGDRGGKKLGTFPCQSDQRLVRLGKTSPRKRWHRRWTDKKQSERNCILNNLKQRGPPYIGPIGPVPKTKRERKKQPSMIPKEKTTIPEPCLTLNRPISSMCLQENKFRLAQNPNLGKKVFARLKHHAHGGPTKEEQKHGRPVEGNKEQNPHVSPHRAASMKMAPKRGNQSKNKRKITCERIVKAECGGETPEYQSDVKKKKGHTLHEIVTRRVVPCHPM